MQILNAVLFLNAGIIFSRHFELLEAIIHAGLIFSRLKLSLSIWKGWYDAFGTESFLIKLWESLCVDMGIQLCCFRMELSKTFDGLKNGCLFQELWLVHLRVLIIETDVNGMKVTVAESHEVQSFLEVDFRFVFDKVGNLGRMMTWVMLRLRHVLFDDRHFGHGQVIVHLILVQVVILQ